LEDGGAGHHGLRGIQFERRQLTAPFAVC
jgi:hypothetical protein